MPRTDALPARLGRLVRAAEPAPGFLTGHDVVLRPAGGRNAAVVLEADGAPRWVLKPAPAEGGAREAGVLAALAATALRDAVPAVHHHGDDGLVLAHVPGVPAGDAPAVPPGHLAALGRVLASLHGLPAPAGTSAPPWVTRLHRPTPRRLSWSSAAVVGLIRDVQADEAMCAALDALADDWTPAALTHGDLRLANVLLGDGDRVTLVDWEAAGPGPPALDLGWAAGDLLLRWAHALDPGAPSEALALRSGGPALAGACAAVARLLTGYGGAPDTVAVVRWAGARLLQAAAEDCQSELFAPARAATVTLAARLVLTRPQAFAERVEAAG
ncbi:MAG: phosphotransferase [Thermoleophilia bacterium]